eukprot:4667369-Prymnesium_polylepis.1
MTTSCLGRTRRMQLGRSRLSRGGPRNPAEREPVGLARAHSQVTCGEDEDHPACDTASMAPPHACARRERTRTERGATGPRDEH